ncbi:hypothetical protein [Streptomyces sp. 891-h]|uniref:hypothetical protein n=1 Tax=Streptomyces sp. 891-h TaxID=2720714 RepID=UPI001FAAE77A|nr:hypothetical protein [Streptomyces sp. 891-h]UNZ16445.1 hypothetical protein HC362_04490 [Streptomyces sp. 891-h]
MSTTRHLVNRRRRLAARPRTGTTTSATGRGLAPATSPATGSERKRPGSPGPEPAAASAAESAAERAGRFFRRSRRLPAVCAVATLVLGGFAGWAANKAEALRDTASAHNSALADAARTSEVKGEITSAVNALFSYDHADPEKNERAARRLLTGRAVEQHRQLLARVRAQDSRQKLLLTTTVTDSAVTTLEGDRARVLLFADQHSTRTAGSAKDGKDGKDKAKSETEDKAKAKGKAKSGKRAEDDNASYAGAMLAVNAVRKDGSWRISAIDTLT